MNGKDRWGNTFSYQPTFIYNAESTITGISSMKTFTTGLLRWAQVWELDYNNPSQEILRTGWVLCYADGFPMTYADANQEGQIRVVATGSYMTAS